MSDYAFSGKIVEAYYTNPELDTVCILYSDGDVNREYYVVVDEEDHQFQACLLYTSPSPRDGLLSRMPSSA